MILSWINHSNTLLTIQKRHIYQTLFLLLTVDNYGIIAHYTFVIEAVMTVVALMVVVLVVFVDVVVIVRRFSVLCV